MTTKEELHVKMIRELSKELTQGEFGEIKHLCSPYLQKGELEKVNSFTELVNELKDKGVEVSWKCNGYSKLIYLFDTIKRPLLMNLIKDYEKRINFAKEESSADTVSAEDCPDARPPVIQRNVAIQTGKDSHGADDCSSTSSSVVLRTAPMKRKQEEINQLMGLSDKSKNSYYLKQIRYALTHSSCELEKLPRGTVTIALLDTGVDRKHNVFSNMKNEAIEEINDLFEHEQYEPEHFGHGTACAAIMVANYNMDDGSKYLGAAPFANLIACNICSENKHANMNALSKALRQLMARDPEEHPDIINISFGAPEDTLDSRQQTQLRKTIEAACKASIVVCAASNEGQRAANTILCPAKYGGIVVGSCDETGNRSKFSGVGRELDVLACGEDLWVPKLETEKDECSAMDVDDELESEMRSFTGTSAAAPLVAGIAAQVLALAEKWGNEEKPRIGDKLRRSLTNTHKMKDAPELWHLFQTLTIRNEDTAC